MHDLVKSSLHQQNIQKTHKQFQECAGRVKHKTRAVILLYLLYKEKEQNGTKGHSATQPLRSESLGHRAESHSMTKEHGRTVKTFCVNWNQKYKKKTKPSFNKLSSSTHLFKAILPNSAAPPGGAAW